MDFLKVDAPRFFPALDFMGGNTDGPWIDTGCALDGWGHLYVSAKQVRYMALALGWADPELETERSEQLAELEALVAKLEGELETERGSKVVSLSDAIALAQSKPPKTPSAA